MTFDYNREDLARGMRACGVREGMVVFCHSNVGYFGRLAGAKSLADLCAVTYEVFRELLGQSGTLIAPTFSYSFGSNKSEPIFDVDSTPSACGAFSEYLRTLPGGWRSADPMFSVVGHGAQAEALTRGVGEECFGEVSIWRRFLDRDGLLCNLNMNAGSTFIHFVERRLGMPYRHNRTFSGTLVEGGVSRAAQAIYYCRDLTVEHALADFARFDELAREAGYVATERVGRGSVVAISARNTARLIEDMVRREPEFLTIGGVRQARCQAGARA